MVRESTTLPATDPRCSAAWIQLPAGAVRLAELVASQLDADGCLIVSLRSGAALRWHDPEAVAGRVALEDWRPETTAPSVPKMPARSEASMTPKIPSAATWMVGLDQSKLGMSYSSLLELPSSVVHPMPSWASSMTISSSIMESMRW